MDQSIRRTKKMPHRKSSTNRSIKRSADLDPVLIELQAIIGHPANLTPAVQSKISYGDLATAIEKGLGDKLASVWASEGAVSYVCLNICRILYSLFSISVLRVYTCV